MDKIVESHFIIGRDLVLTNLIKQYFDINWRKEYEGQLGNIVYLDIVEKDVIFASVGLAAEFKLRKPFFTGFLKDIDCTDFNNLLLLVSTYPYYGEISPEARRSSTLKNHYLDLVLKETNGWLVYTYQLEKLYQMAIRCDLEGAIRFRRNINKKVVKSYEEAKEIKLFGTSLFKIIEHRMKFSGVFNANYYRTYRLFEYLNL